MKRYYIFTLGTLMAAFSFSSSHAQCKVALTADSGICQLPSTLKLNADFGIYEIGWYFEGNLIQSYKATWDTSGIGTTVAGGNGRGTQLNQIRPSDVEVDDSLNVFVSDNYRNNMDTNSRIVKWPPLSTTGEIVADGWRSPTTKFQPGGIAFDYERNFYIADNDHDRILKWVLGAASGTVYAGGNGNGSAANQFNKLGGICFDTAKNLYVVDAFNSRLQKWAAGAVSGTTIATGLGNPQFVDVDLEGNVYVSDFNASRILRYAPGSTVGVTVAGDPYDLGGFLSSGTNDSFLNHPSGVYVDGLKNLYISDFSNSRVQLWPAGSKVGITIGGGNGAGTGPNQLSFPNGIRQDKWGNVYVTDISNKATTNHRVQRYNPSILDTFLATQQGTYTVVIKAYNGCVIKDSISVYAGVQPMPVITINGFQLGVGASYVTYQWLLNDTIISGATNSTLDVEANGNYRVIVFDKNGCTDTSDVYSVLNYTSIDDITALAKEIRIYPNPVREELNIKTPFNVNIAIFSVEGKLIKNQRNSKRISVKELSSGFYLLQISDKNGKVLKMEKFVKE